MQPVRPTGRRGTTARAGSEISLMDNPLNRLAAHQKSAIPGWKGMKTRAGGAAMQTRKEDVDSVDL